MQSPAFIYSPGWTLSTVGADPGEPADPWNEPAGVVEFTYQGNELALRLATGDYWGYLYVTVDGEPVSMLPTIHGNENGQGTPSSYKPLYDPENRSARPEDGAALEPVWIRVHDASDATTPHEVRVEVWRGWGQTPLRAVAVDALPPEPPPIWPGVALLVAAFWLAVAGLWTVAVRIFTADESDVADSQPGLLAGALSLIERYAAILATLGLVLVCVGTAIELWFFCLGGLALLGLAALVRPALWIAALLFGLPFYFAYPLPLLPGRSFSLIDVGVFGGIVLWTLYAALHRAQMDWTPSQTRRWFSPGWMLAALVSWSLIAASAAARTDVALHEWRTVFLAGGVFALLLVATLATSPQPARKNRSEWPFRLRWRHSAPRPLIREEALQSQAGLGVPPKVGGPGGLRDQRLILWAWLAGATVVSLVGLWQSAAGSMLIDAEGVQRIRAFYGSPNNLALYLERSLAVTLALGLFARDRSTRLVWLALAGIQGAALLLTFSKGALLLALPVMFVVLWLGGWRLLRQSGQSTRPLWILATLAAVGFLAMTPFLGTERFQRLLDFSQGTGFLRLQLWRSSWRMALDHLPFGVGPDNFLYAYRSGYILPQAWQEPNLNHPHNWLLDWWTRLGLVGLALGLGFWASAIARLWRRFRTAGEAITGEQGIWALGFLAASLAALAHGWIDLSYALPDLMIVWCTMFFLLRENG